MENNQGCLATGGVLVVFAAFASLAGAVFFKDAFEEKNKAVTPQETAQSVEDVPPVAELAADTAWVITNTNGVCDSVMYVNGVKQEKPTLR